MSDAGNLGISADRIWSSHFHDPANSAAQARALIDTLPEGLPTRARGWCALTIAFNHLFYSADPAKAEPWLDLASREFAALEDVRGQLLASTGAARLRLNMGDPLGSREALQALQEPARDLLPPQDRFYVINALGATYFYTDQLDETIRHLYQALEVLRGLGVTPQLPTLLSNLAAVLITVGDYEPARDLAREGLAIAPRFNNPQLFLFARSNLAEALLGLGDRDGALATVEAMLRDTAGELVRSAQNHYCAIAAEVYVDHGMLDRAESFLSTAKAIYDDQPGSFNEVHYRWAAATLAAARHPGPEALAEIEAAVEVARRRQHVAALCKAYALLARRNAALGRFEQAYENQVKLLDAHTRRMSNRASVKYYLLKVEHELADVRAERDRAEMQRRQLEAASRQLGRLNAELQRKMREVEDLQNRLQEEAIHDPLTQVFNRRYLDTALPGLIDAAARRREPLALALLDLDHFKLVNDVHGHLAGDQVLMELAQVFIASLRASDMVCRYGGEEFCLVLPGTDAEAARGLLASLAERLRRFTVSYRDRCLTAFTFSAGISGFPAHGRTPAELILSADRALYRAKGAGRNLTVIAEPLD
jgi:diguanylate cyclase (GGDEF)-like protein